MDFHTLSPLFSHAGAAGWGMCAFTDLALSTDQLEKANVLCPAPAGVFIAAFPYWAGTDQPQGNLSYYARGEDYHLALSRSLPDYRRNFPGKPLCPERTTPPCPNGSAPAWLGWGFWGGMGWSLSRPMEAGYFWALS